MSPRFTGDGNVVSTDVAMIRQFVVGNFVPQAGFNEFQRADSAPRVDSGNGVLNSGDVVQVRRYAAALDPLQPAGGPASPVIAPPAYIGGAFLGKPEGRRIQIVPTAAAAGSKALVGIDLVGEGGETAVNFTLEYDPTKLADPIVTLGAGMPEGTALTVNAGEAGRLRVLVDAGEAFSKAASRKQLMTIEFDVAANAPSGDTALAFGNSRDEGSIADTRGDMLKANYTDGSVSISGPNAAGVEIAGRVLTPDGRGLRNARVTITDEEGIERTVTTSSFGYYRFDGVRRGATLVMGVRSNRYRFASQVVQALDSLSDFDLIGLE